MRTRLSVTTRIAHTQFEIECTVRTQFESVLYVLSTYSVRTQYVLVRRTSTASTRTHASTSRRLNCPQSGRLKQQVIDAGQYCQ